MLQTPREVMWFKSGRNVFKKLVTNSVPTVQNCVTIKKR
jgi:hypothetical protein